MTSVTHLVLDKCHARAHNFCMRTNPEHEEKIRTHQLAPADIYQCPHVCSVTGSKSGVANHIRARHNNEGVPEKMLLAREKPEPTNPPADYQDHSKIQCNACRFPTTHRRHEPGCPNASHR